MHNHVLEKIDTVTWRCVECSWERRLLGGHWPVGVAYFPGVSITRVSWPWHTGDAFKPKMPAEGETFFRWDDFDVKPTDWQLRYMMGSVRGGKGGLFGPESWRNI